MSSYSGPGYYDDPEIVSISRSPEGRCTATFMGYVDRNEPTVRELLPEDASIVVGINSRRIRKITVPYGNPPISQLEKMLEIAETFPGLSTRSDRYNQQFCAEALRQAMSLSEAKIWPPFACVPDFEKLLSLLTVID